MVKRSIDPTASERAKLSRAFSAIRRSGGMTQTGLCCQTCSWSALEARGHVDGGTAAVHHMQGFNEAFPEGALQMRSPLHIYHAGDSRFICEALRNAGLRVEWSGSDEQAITVLPDWPN